MTTPSLTGQPAQAALPVEEFKDLGFGSEVARGTNRRLLNRNGGFNVVLDGLNPFSSLSIYHWLLTISWPAFLAFIVVCYIGVNVLFAFAFLLCGQCASNDYWKFRRAYFLSGVLFQRRLVCYDRLRKHHPGWSSSEPFGYHRGAT